MRTRAARSQKIIPAAFGTAALVSLILLKVFVVGGGFALPSGSGGTSTTVVSIGQSTSRTTGSDLNYSTIPSIFVSSEYPNGTATAGVYTALVQNGTTLATAYTPVIFRVPSGEAYQVIVTSSSDLYFNQWSSGFTSSVMPVTSGSAETELKAVFTTSPQSPPSTPYSVSVSSGLLSGGNLTGILVDLRVDGYPIQSGYTPLSFNDLEPGIPYQVVVYWYGDDYFRHFSDGDLNRYETVTFNTTGTQSVSYDAQFQQVPSSQVASLNVIAKFANGTVIGTSYNNATYIQHTPGVWMVVFQQGMSAPLTGSDTGGSLLPFVLAEGDNYTVEMSNYESYHFAYWADTNSSDPDRSLVLNSNTTLVAIYD